MMKIFRFYYSFPFILLILFFNCKTSTGPGGIPGIYSEPGLYEPNHLELKLEWEFDTPVLKVDYHTSAEYADYYGIVILPESEYNAILSGQSYGYMPTYQSTDLTTYYHSLSPEGRFHRLEYIDGSSIYHGPAEFNPLLSYDFFGRDQEGLDIEMQIPLTSADVGKTYYAVLYAVKNKNTGASITAWNDCFGDYSPVEVLGNWNNCAGSANTYKSVSKIYSYPTYNCVENHPGDPKTMKDDCGVSRSWNECGCSEFPLEDKIEVCYYTYVADGVWESCGTFTYKLPVLTAIGSSVDSITIPPPSINIYAIFGDGGAGKAALETYLTGIGATKTDNTYTYNNFTIIINTTEQSLSDALNSKDSCVVFDGHSNYGLGPSFFTGLTSISDFMNIASPLVSLNWIDMREPVPTGQGHPDFEITGTEIPANPQNYLVPILNILKFPNINGIGDGDTFSLSGTGYNRYHYEQAVGNNRIIVNGGDADKPTLQHQVFFYNGCFSGRLFLEPFQRGTFFYTESLCSSEFTTTEFVKGIIENKTWDDIKTSMNTYEPGYNYYSF